MSSEKIHQYYNDIAKIYDADRFENTYGKYIHAQENSFLKKHLKGEHILSLACGTGRFMEYAQTGADLSEEMLALAQTKYPGKTFNLADAAETGFSDNQFDSIFSLHLFMHLDEEKASQIFEETGRILKPGGRFIFDFPSAKRRNLGKRTSADWHASTSYDIKKLKQLTQSTWKLTYYSGTLFLPVHRIPRKMRKIFIGLDNALCKSFLKEYASHLIVILEKK